MGCAEKMDCFLQWMLRNALSDQLGPRELKFEILPRLKTISFSKHLQAGNLSPERDIVVAKQFTPLAAKTAQMSIQGNGSKDGDYD